jgi:hypothetical protein
VHGDTAWLVDFPKIDMLAEGVFDARVTTVMLRVDGEWKLAHNHLSEGCGPTRSDGSPGAARTSYRPGRTINRQLREAERAELASRWCR